MENFYKNGWMTAPEYAILCKWYDYMCEKNGLKPDAFVYLRVSPEVLVKRIKKRGREEEKCVGVERLVQLHNLYEAWVGEC